jgi:pSer/pThr/pTyr-binding forkhead associated (FHA) protein
VKLKVLVGSGAGKIVSIPGGEFLIGRGEDCQLRPRSSAISRRHCALIVTESQVSLRDFGSKNGTYVNGERIEHECGLKKGDCVKIGPLEFEIWMDHRLGNATRSEVKDVKEAAARTAGAKLDDWDVGKWLEEADEADREQRLVQPETRQYKLDETDEFALKKDGEPAGGDTAVAETKEKGKKKSKPEETEPGKLPRDFQRSKDTKEAAEDMLKRFFKRE